MEGKVHISNYRLQYNVYFLRATLALFSLLSRTESTSTFLACPVSILTVIFEVVVLSGVMCRCQFIFRILMSQASKFPPLPKPALSSKFINFQKIRPEQRCPPALSPLTKVTANSISIHEHAGSKSSRSKERPVSSSTAKSSHKSSSNVSIQARSRDNAELFRDGRPYFVMPQVTAKSWVLYEMKTNRCLYGQRNYKKREIASLTKMLNLTTILNIVDSFGLDAKKIKARASPKASNVNGTTA